jgi:tRNA (guanine37-N1)-methyltransferase
MRIDFVTIFPDMFASFFTEGVIARGVKQGLLDVRVWDLREYAVDRHRSTDDEAYGGGPGMVMLASRCSRAVEAIDGGHLVMTSPQGRRFDQRVAAELKDKQHVVFLCGRYEGFDHRVHEALQPDEISIGDFVVSGGELPAMLMADAIGRLIPGVVGNSGSVEEDSFFRGLLDYPHYTRPEEVRGRACPTSSSPGITRKSASGAKSRRCEPRWRNGPTCWRRPSSTTRRGKFFAGWEVLARAFPNQGGAVSRLY